MIHTLELSVVSGRSRSRICLCYAVIVFFQAEDGIRDLVRSRGLGDVYKRQDQDLAGTSRKIDLHRASGKHLGGSDIDIARSHDPVSYTHLTLPTSDLV